MLTTRLNVSFYSPTFLSITNKLLSIILETKKKYHEKLELSIPQWKKNVSMNHLIFVPAINIHVKIRYERE